MADKHIIVSPESSQTQPHTPQAQIVQHQPGSDSADTLLLGQSTTTQPGGSPKEKAGILPDPPHSEPDVACAHFLEMDDDDDSDSDDDWGKEADDSSPCPSDASPNLYVANLPEHIHDPELAQLFEPFGKILKLKVMIDLTRGCSRGFGFVLMESTEAAVKARRALAGVSIAGNRPLTVQFSQHKTEHLTAPSDFLMLKNVPPTASTIDIINLCAKYGTVASVKFTSQSQHSGKSATVYFTAACDGPRRAEAELHDRTNPFDATFHKLFVKQGEPKEIRLIRQLQVGNARGGDVLTEAEKEALIHGASWDELMRSKKRQRKDRKRAEQLAMATETQRDYRQPPPQYHQQQQPPQHHYPPQWAAPPPQWHRPSGNMPPPPHAYHRGPPPPPSYHQQQPYPHHGAQPPSPHLPQLSQGYSPPPFYQAPYQQHQSLSQDFNCYSEPVYGYY